MFVVCVGFGDQVRAMHFCPIVTAVQTIYFSRG